MTTQSSPPPQHWQELPAYLAEMNREVSSGTDRGIVLVSGSMADVMLRRLLEAFLAVGTNAEELFGHQKPLGAFSDRIDLAVSLGLVPIALGRRLHLLRKIRNDMAHQLGQGFTTQAIKSRVDALADGLNLNDVSDTKVKFAGATTALLIALANQIKPASLARRAADLSDLKPLEDMPPDRKASTLDDD